MKKSFFAKAGVVGMLSGSALISQAVPFSDLDSFQQGYRLDSNSSTKHIPNMVLGTFNLVNDDPDSIPDVVGFNASTDLMSTASAWFSFRNPSETGNSSQMVTMNLDSIANADAQGRSMPASQEFSLFEGAATIQALVTLNTYGFYLYAVRVISGDVILDGAQFNGNALRNGSASVPDAGSTLALSSMAFLGLHFASRRLRKS